MKQLPGLLVLLCLPWTMIRAQTVIDTVVVRKDPRIDMLIERQIVLNRINSRRTGNGLFKGYRLQVLNTKSREQAFTTKADLLSQFPDQKTYVIFQSPFFRIRFGNFISRKEAEEYQKILGSIYPQGIYIVADKVEYTLTENDLLTGDIKNK